MANGKNGGGFWKGYVYGFLTVPAVGILASVVVGTIGLIIGTRSGGTLTPGAGAGNGGNGGNGNGNDTGRRTVFDVNPTQ